MSVQLFHSHSLHTYIPLHTFYTINSLYIHFHYIHFIPYIPFHSCHTNIIVFRSIHSIPYIHCSPYIPAHTFHSIYFRHKFRSIHSIPFMLHVHFISYISFHTFYSIHATHILHSYIPIYIPSHTFQWFHITSLHTCVCKTHTHTLPHRTQTDGRLSSFNNYISYRDSCSYHGHVTVLWRITDVTVALDRARVVVYILVGENN